MLFFSTGKNKPQDMGDGQKWHPPAPAFSKGCGASDHVVDFGTNGWVPRTEGGWVLEAEWLGAGILRPSFHPKN